MMPLVNINNISIRVNQKDIIQDVSFQIEKGKVIGLVGPNGGGKSTILKALLGLVPLSAGQIVFEKPLSFGYLPQRPPNSFDLPITVSEALHIYRATTPKAKELLARLKLNHIVHSPLYQLSGGELQKVFFIIALAENPDLILLDEPSASIDSESDEALRQLILSEKQAGKSIIIVSHDIDSIIKNTDDIVCLNQKVCCSGKTALVVRSQEFQELFSDQHYHHQHD